MAKLSRTMLKGLVKECLVEILSEGLSGGTITEASRPTVTTAKNKRQPQPRRRGADLISYGEQKPEPEPSINSTISDRISANSGGNSIMESILRDTAMNTLPTMMAADKKESHGMAQRVAQGDAATKAMASADPMDIFEGSSNWAALAFSGDLKNS